MAEDTTIQQEYAQTSYLDAQTRLLRRFIDAGATAYPMLTPKRTLPLPAEIKARRLFDEGDHWQSGEGFIGQLPTGEAVTERTDLLKKAFSPEDVVSEILDTHVQNVLGDDPIIELESDMADAETADVLEAVKEWFDKRDGVGILANALRAARRETASILRAFIPSGMIDGNGRIQARDLRDALSKIWIRSEYIEAGGVIVDEATATELGLFLYRMRIGNADVSLCEYAYVNEQGQTIWGTASAHNAGVGAEIAEPFMLNGALPIYQLTTKAIITSSVCQAQRAINLSGTMLTRNNNLAGSRERLAIGVQPPGEWIDRGINDQGQPVREFVPAEMKTGPATMNFLSAMPIHDAEGRVTAFANPNVIFTDPVAIDSFIGTSMHWRSEMYSKAKMRHLLMADDATASGRSRIEARKEFQSSLNESKQVTDPAGKWMIELALNIAAHFIGQPGRFLNTRVNFDSQVSTIELTPEETSQIRENFKIGLIDMQTALEQLNFKNVQEILNRVQATATPAPTPPPTATGAAA
jgi:hypothetical protein